MEKKGRLLVARCCCDGHGFLTLLTARGDPTRVENASSWEGNRWTGVVKEFE